MIPRSKIQQPSPNLKGKKTIQENLEKEKKRERN